MKYTKELTQQLLQLYTTEEVPQIAKILSEQLGEDVPERSITAKLSTLGVYRKKQYLTKRGEVPVRKSEYIERIAKILEIDPEILESLEKANKNVLELLAGLVKPAAMVIPDDID